MNHGGFKGMAIDQIMADTYMANKFLFVYTGTLCAPALKYIPIETGLEPGFHFEMHIDVFNKEVS